ncbi:MAG: DNA-protecting protein DprA [Streptosporangiales bacterium]|nr:DNA-protecting protein DprA [Streptosporangiales bacterium]
MTTLVQSDEAERLARVALSRIVEPGDQRVGKLVTETSAHEVWAALQSDELQVRGVDGYRLRLPDADPARDLEHATKAGVRVVVPGDPEWPPALDAFQVKRPLLLWVKGEADLRSLTDRAVAVVGARAATDYGAYVAAELASSLADRSWTVVSGGAYGIDGRAHRGALAASGPTIAVLPCGLDVCYPRGHDGLFREIAANGVLVGEFPPGSEPTRYRFLERNRVIAGLAAGVVVVEAALRSGASNTARWAEKLGRPVMAVPGPVTSTMSAGCHQLLQSHVAECVTDANDVVEMVGRLGADLAPQRQGSSRPRDALDHDAGLVLEAFGARGEFSADELARRAGLAPRRVLRALGNLLTAGWIERGATGWSLGEQAKVPEPRDTPEGGA